LIQSALQAWSIDPVIPIDFEVVRIWLHRSVCDVMIARKPLSKGISTKRVIVPPGGLLLRITRFLMSAESYRTNVVPFVYDMQIEHAEAMKANEKWRTRVIVVREYLRFARNAHWYAIASFLIKFFFTAK
jgi:hypothetical protein